MLIPTPQDPSLVHTALDFGVWTILHVLNRTRGPYMFLSDITIQNFDPLPWTFLAKITSTHGVIMQKRVWRVH